MYKYSINNETTWTLLEQIVTNKIFYGELQYFTNYFGKLAPKAIIWLYLN